MTTPKVFTANIHDAQVSLGEEERHMYKALGLLVLATTMSGLTPSLAQAARETLQTMLAAQIRIQGFACDKPLSAIKDRRRSKPDHGVWVLKCSNATYRINRAPDMAAKVEPVR